MKAEGFPLHASVVAQAVHGLSGPLPYALEVFVMQDVIPPVNTTQSIDWLKRQLNIINGLVQLRGELQTCHVAVSTAMAGTDYYAQSHLNTLRGINKALSSLPMVAQMLDSLWPALIDDHPLNEQGVEIFNMLVSAVSDIGEPFFKGWYKSYPYSPDEKSNGDCIDGLTDHFELLMNEEDEYIEKNSSTWATDIQAPSMRSERISNQLSSLHSSVGMLNRQMYGMRSAQTVHYQQPRQNSDNWPLLPGLFMLTLFAAA